MSVIYVQEWLDKSTGKYKNQKESDTAKSVRVMKEAALKPGSRTYENALELQIAQAKHKERMKTELELVQ